MAKAKPSIPGPIPMVDKDWRAENDYRSLCCAAEIVDDPKRLKAAIAYGKDHMKATEDFFSQVTKATGGKNTYKA